MLWSSRGPGAGPCGVWPPSRKDAGCSGLGRSATCVVPAPGPPCEASEPVFPDTLPITPLLAMLPWSPAILRAHQARAGPSLLPVSGGDDRAGGQGRPGGPVLKASYGVCRHHHCLAPEHSHPIKTPHARLAVTAPSPQQPPGCSLSQWICLESHNLWLFLSSCFLSELLPFALEMKPLPQIGVTDSPSLSPICETDVGARLVSRYYCGMRS